MTKKFSKQHLKRVLKARWDRILLVLGMSSAAIFCSYHWGSEDWRVVAMAVVGYGSALTAIWRLTKTMPPLPPLKAEPVKPEDEPEKEEQP